MWQDYVLVAMQVVFCLTLVPMLFTKEKPPLLSSIPTGVALLTIAATYITLELWLAAIGSGIVGIQWLVLTYQRLTRKDVTK